MTQKLTAEQLQHINNCIREHKVGYLTYRGNYLGWRHYIELPENLFPEFNEEVVSKICEHMASYSDHDIKSIRCIYVYYERREIWINLVSGSGEIITPICPTSIINGMYQDAEKLASRCLNFYCEAAYRESLNEAIKYCEEEWMMCGKEELLKLVPYDEWMNLFIKKIVTSAWSGCVPSCYSEDEWRTDPPLSPHLPAAPARPRAESDDLPF